MPQKMNGLLQTYISEIKKIYGTHLSKIILYGSYARGDFRPDSDVDIMILLDLSDLDLKKYSKELSYMTYDFNLDIDIDKNYIVINAKKEEEKIENEKAYKKSEFKYGEFSRTVYFPEEIDVEKTEAKLEHGVLKIHAPKKYAEKEAKKKLTVK